MFPSRTKSFRYKAFYKFLFADIYDTWPCLVVVVVVGVVVVVAINMRQRDHDVTTPKKGVTWRRHPDGETGWHGAFTGSNPEFGE